jgi:hypothetical protein
MVIRVGELAAVESAVRCTGSLELAIQPLSLWTYVVLRAGSGTVTSWGSETVWMKPALVYV